MKLTKHQHEHIEQPYVELYYQKYTEIIRQVESFIANVDNTQIIVRSEDGQEVLNLRDIYYFEMVDRRCFACLDHDTKQIPQNLKELEDNFSQFGFIRVNKSIIINIHNIVKMKSDYNMRILAELKNGEKIQVNRSYKAAFQQFLTKFLTKEELDYE